MISEGKKASAEKEKTLEKQEKEWSLMMLVKSPKKGEKNKAIWSRDHSISEGEVEKRIQNQARRVRTKKTRAVYPSKASRRNDTATDPSKGAAANNVC